MVDLLCATLAAGGAIICKKSGEASCAFTILSITLAVVEIHCTVDRAAGSTDRTVLNFDLKETGKKSQALA